MGFPSGVLTINPPVGNEMVTIANQSELYLQTPLSAISAYANGILVTNTSAAAATLTTAQMGGTGQAPAGQVIEFCTGSTSGSMALTTPTVAQMIAAFPNWAIGTGYEFDIVNAGTSQNIVFTAGTGWTLAGGSATVANNVWRKYIVVLTSATVITATGVEVGSYS